MFEDHIVTRHKIREKSNHQEKKPVRAQPVFSPNDEAQNEKSENQNKADKGPAIKEIQGEREIIIQVLPQGKNQQS